MNPPQRRGSSSDDQPPLATVSLDENGDPVVSCEKCGSTNLALDGWDIDKCRDCDHWRYR